MIYTGKIGCQTIAPVAAMVTALACGTLSTAVYSQDKLSKFLLIKLSRDQSAVLCKSTVFTGCMAFTEEQCLELSEKALEQCLAPLPDTIDLAELQNEALEACPKDVYDKAGFSDEKAQQCLAEAMKP